ncbi:hypothetical protein, partial [Nocardioides sp.]|uniref:hypothetical protein n=1 Tax=Nocardioides sp. TaxID=35761 RepID=UPI003566145A
MTARVNSAEGGTNGVTVTTANSGGASGDAWDSMYVPSGQSITFASAAAQKGTLGYRMVYGSASGVGANVRWTLTGWPQLRARWYMRFSAYPTGMASFCYVTNAGNADAIAWLRMDASGKFIVQGDWNDVDLFRSAAAIPLNTWIRVELAMVPGTTISNGVIKFAYATADAAPTETYSNTSANLDVYGNLGRLYVGKVDGPWNATVDFDDLAADDADVATFIGASSAGPVIVDPTPAPVPPA